MFVDHCFVSIMCVCVCACVCIYIYVCFQKLMMIEGGGNMIYIQKKRNELTYPVCLNEKLESVLLRSKIFIPFAPGGPVIGRLNTSCIR